MIKKKKLVLPLQKINGLEKKLTLIKILLTELSKLKKKEYKI